MTDTISCPQCSSPLPAGAMFCTTCGHRLEAPAAPAGTDEHVDPAPTVAPPMPFTPPEDSTRIDTPGLNDQTQAFASPPAPSSGPPSSGEQAAAPWQPADTGTPAPAAWSPPPQTSTPQPQGSPQPWQQQQQPGAPAYGAPQPGGAPQGWGAPTQGTQQPWDNTGTASASTGAADASPFGGLAALAGGLLTVIGIFIAWFELSSGGVSESITGWEMASGDKGLESKDPYILLALGIAALAIGVVLFMGQKRPIARIAAVVVGIAIVGITANDWMTTASLVEDNFPSTVELSGAVGFYLTIVGGVVTAASAALPAKK